MLGRCFVSLEQVFLLKKRGWLAINIQEFYNPFMPSACVAMCHYEEECFLYFFFARVGFQGKHSSPMSLRLLEKAGHWFMEATSLCFNFPCTRMSILV